MNNHSSLMDTVRTLCEAAVEGQLTIEQRAELEQLVLTSAEARRLYVELAHQHACLHWFVDSFVDAIPEAVMIPRHKTTEPAKRWRWVGLGFAASILLAGMLFGLSQWLLSGPKAFATLHSTKACRWDGGTLPTETGSKIGSGRLRLAEGLARLVFDNGAEVTIEAPTQIELLSNKKCVLHSGRLTAYIPPSATGFIVETPTATLTDIGTEFGVHVHAGQPTADVQVFTGQVDVQHRQSGQTESLLTGHNRRFTEGDIQAFNPNLDVPLHQSFKTDRERVVHIPTSLGRGQDGYIQDMDPLPGHNISDTLLLVKYSMPKHPGWDRKGYLSLDLNTVAGQQIVDAELTLTFAPTGMGYAAHVPDATFTVYGLTDESLDGWEEKTLCWKNAPANRKGGAAVDATKTVPLGTFVIAQGQLQGTRSISGAKLIEFLKQDTNRLATFILVRETAGTAGMDLVHGFASKRHPELQPPTLKLTVVPPS